MSDRIEALQASTLGLVVVVLALMALAHVGLRWWIRRRSRQEEDGTPSPCATGVRKRLTRALSDAAPPVLLLIWIHGVTFVAALLLPRVGGPAFVNPGLLVLRWAHGLGVLIALCWLLSRAGHFIEALLADLAARSDSTWDKVMFPLAGKAARRTLPLLALMAGVSALAPTPAAEQQLSHAATLLLIGVVAFLLYQAVDAVAALVLARHRIDVRDNLQARTVHTQVVVLKKVAVAIITVFALASMLMVFESARQFGASILASAGIAGIIVGFAAQRSIATLLAGFQIALTQPIRVDDVVIVENEWGRIEDITLTYVVVRVWDLRRLVLPITYFIEQPFQNWTRSSSNITGTVLLHADYAVPLDALRQELTRILSASPLWDGRVNVLQVTGAGERALEIRALVSAADASLAWDLRCEVREKLVGFLQRNHPETLPRLRAAVEATLPTP